LFLDLSVYLYFEKAEERGEKLLREVEKQGALGSGLSTDVQSLSQTSYLN
jgi:hypothetical protein